MLYEEAIHAVVNPTLQKKQSAVSIFFTKMPSGLDDENGDVGSLHDFHTDLKSTTASMPI